MGEGSCTVPVVLLVSSQPIDIVLELVVVCQNAVVCCNCSLDVALQVLNSGSHLCCLVATALPFGFLQLLLVLLKLVEYLCDNLCYCFMSFLDREIPAFFLLHPAGIIVDLSLHCFQIALVASDPHTAGVLIRILA